MKLELDIPDELVGRIADAVVDRLRPMLLASAASVASRRGQPRTVEVGPKAVGGFDPLGLPESGYLRLKEVLALIPVSKSTWYKGVADGRYPKPTNRFGPRIAAWDAREIRRLLEADSGPKGRALSA